MKKTFFYLFLLGSNLLLAQSENDPCSAPCLSLSGITIGTNPQADGMSPNGNLPCGGSTSEDNPTWYTFVAGCTNFKLDVSVTGCASGSSIEVTLFEGDDCGAVGAAGCVHCVTGGSVSLATIPGKQYWIQVDGCAEAVCNFSLIYDSNCILKNIPKPIITGLLTACKGTTQNYSAFIPGGIVPAGYTWSIVPASAGQIIGQGDLNIQVKWNQTGTFQLCATPKFNVKCPVTGIQKACMNVSVTELKEAVCSVTLCAKQVPFEYSLIHCIKQANPKVLGSCDPDVFTVLGPLGTTKTATINYTMNSSGCSGKVKLTAIVKPKNSIDTSNCFSHPTITGNVFLDYNDNGIKDANDTEVSNLQMEGLPDVYAFTDTSGNYKLLVDTVKTYTVSPKLQNTFFSIKPNQRTVKTTKAFTQNYPNQGFRLVPKEVKADLAVSIVATTVMRPGFKGKLTVTYKNIGTTVLDGSLKIQIDSALSYTFFSPNQHIKVYDFNFSQLKPLETKSVDIEVQVSVKTPLGKVLLNTVEGSVKNTVDSDLSNNVANVKTTVVGSYDPNDKNADLPYMEQKDLNNGKPITYTIRFQNTGTYYAELVEIHDTLSPLFDIGTLKNIDISHQKYEMTIATDYTKPNKPIVVKWIFENIMLPDSSTDKAGSQGFVRFSIQPKANLPLETELHNKAYIYFDYNLPILTNSACTMIGKPKPIKSTVGTFVNTVKNVDLQGLFLKTYPSFKGKIAPAVLTLNTKKTGFFNKKVKVYVVETGCEHEINLTIWSIKKLNFKDDNPVSFKTSADDDFSFDEKNITLYPNPSDGIFNLDFLQEEKENYQWQVFDLQGRLILKNENTQNIDLHNVSNGIYYLKVFGRNWNKTFKMVKQ